MVIVDEPDCPDSIFSEVGRAAIEKSGTLTVTLESEEELATKFASAGV